MKNWLLGGLFLALGLPVWADRVVTAIVTLEGEPLAELAAPAPGGAQRAGARPSAAARRSQLASKRSEVRPQLAALGAQITAEHDTLVHAVVVRVPESKLADLRQVAGVRSVRKERLLERHLESSTPFLRAPNAWRSTASGLTGTGIKIGIIDSGIDYHHAMFGGSGDVADYDNNNPTVIEAGSFPTAKVAGGRDFAGDDYDAGGQEGDPFPTPDPDPLDPSANGHGSHVAGIASGLGVLKSGNTFTGDYTKLTDFSQFEVGPGVAPGAKLYALKVFGRRGSSGFSVIVSALEWALDPNGDGSFSDRLHVVNLSLGSSFGVDDGNDDEVAAIDRLSRNGVVCVISAGNSGNVFYVMGSPGIAARGITVANSFDDGAVFQSLKVLEPTVIAGDYQFEEGSFTKLLEETGPITGEVVYVEPNLACDDLSNAAALDGKIALIDRGTCFFVDKIRKAQAAGALAVIMVNNTEGPPISMGGSGDTSDIDIPGVMISRADGTIFKSQLNNGLTVTLAAGGTVARPELADQISDSSSRGPVAPDSRLKPDIAAPGTGIKSAKAGAGTEGILETGTSMSAPQVSGAAALVRQAHPTWTAEDIKAALMNTAAVMHGEKGELYPESRVGAGRVDVAAAASTPFTARADTISGEVSLSFGSLLIRQTTTRTNRIRLDNFSNASATFALSVSNSVAQRGVTLTPLANSVTVPAGGSATVEVKLEVDPSGIDQLYDASSPRTLNERPRFSTPEASGQVWFHSGTTALHLPWHVSVRAVANYDVFALAVGLPTATRSDVPLPTRGPTAHAQPLVSAFLLGGTGTQVSAWGAASDFPTKKSVPDTTLYFGVALNEAWQTPQRVFSSVDVQIDLDNNGQPDFTLINSTAGNFLAQDEYSVASMNDVLVSVVRDDKATEDPLKSAVPLNVFEPAFRDTAAFQNAVLVHSAKAGELGLSATKTKFRYRVNYNEDTEVTAWTTFDLAKPVVDATAFGLAGTPFFDEGRDVKFAFDRAEATAAGFTTASPPRALLLHQHNGIGALVDNIRLDLAKTDTDNDTLPDVWELEFLGELTSNATGDADGDALLNAAEFLAGTNPLDVHLTSAPVADSVPALRWNTVSSRFYTIERGTSVNGPFTPFRRRIAATPPQNSFVPPGPAAGETFFYRVKPD